MEDNHNDLKYLSELITDLKRDSTAILDLDQMRDRLSKIAMIIKNSNNNEKEHTALRADYEQRIGGMVKAIAVADRKHNATEDALSLLDELSQLDVTSLLRRYNKISSRFRDCFPTSFYKPHGHTNNHWEDYK